MSMPGLLSLKHHENSILLLLWLALKQVGKNHQNDRLISWCNCNLTSRSKLTEYIVSWNYADGILNLRFKLSYWMSNACKWQWRGEKLVGDSPSNCNLVWVHFWLSSKFQKLQPFLIEKMTGLLPMADSFSFFCRSSLASSIDSTVTGGPPKLMWLYSSSFSLSKS